MRAVLCVFVLGCSSSAANPHVPPPDISDASGPPPGSDAGVDVGPKDNRVPIFVAQGALGRTTISCDDGQTWVANHSWDLDADPLLCGMKQNAICYVSNCNYKVGNSCVSAMCCNDTPDVPKGIVFTGKEFVATWGWGALAPGSMRRSVNGVDWTTTLSPEDTFGGIAYGAGRVVAAARDPYWSSDGTTWTPGQTANFLNPDGTPMWSVRQFAFADYAGGRFIAVASGDVSRDMLISSDGGDTWWRPSVLPNDCAQLDPEYGGILYGNGVIVAVDQAANACRSTDGGQTWSVKPTGLKQVLSRGVWTGSEFLFWGDDAFMIRSTDGATWTKTPMATQYRIGPVARSASGTFVALSTVWDSYDKQTFMRSTDGLTWTILSNGAFVASHEIHHLAFGYALPSAVCPAK